MADTWERLKDEKTYPAAPELACDVVMKGGITSGIAYPLAVCEIAAKYRLVNVGGSSAGAIAAAAAAAAEVGRTVPGAGFARLAGLPGRLAGAPGAKHSMLFELFQPQPAMRPYYRLLMAFVVAGLSNGQRVRRAAKEAFRSFWPGALLGGALGALAAAFLIALDARVDEVRADPWAVLGVFLGLVAAVVVMVAGAVGGMLVQGARTGKARFPANMFGLCSGYVAAGSASDGCSVDEQKDPSGKCTTKPLTTWLADEIDTLAGRTPGPGSDPLTLGDLCDRDVQLRMFTTNLTNGRPYTIPFREVFYFDESEFQRLFPPRVVDWMVAHGEQVSDRTLEVLARTSPNLRPLPRWDDLPVIVATRMSLSFPLLLTAVPLWQIDWSEPEPKPYCCWFSDGGITSNFPVHFFDAPIPRRPTFGLNLGPFKPGEQPSTDQCKNVFWPKENSEGLWPRWSGVDTIGRFGRALADTMQNWSDNAQVLLPGYRDRIVLIKHTDDEGGMNLDMPRERILAFAERGRCAGATLVAKFSEADPPADDKLGWDNHRWVRYRSMMNTLETFVEGWLRGYGYDPAPSERTFPDLIETPVSYDWASKAQRERAAAVNQLVVALAGQWMDLPPDGGVADRGCERPPEDKRDEPYDPGHPFRKGAPHPRPRLRITPDF